MAVETIVELVSSLGRQGIRLWREEDQLRFRAPQGALTPELKAELVRRKTEILSFLSQVSMVGPGGGAAIERIPREGELPLSFAQERLWFVERWEPETATYSIYDALTLTGDLTVAAAAAAMGEIERRHEVLRTTFDTVSGRPVPRIRPPAVGRLPVADLSGLPPAARDAQTAALLAAETARPFDLDRGPLLRTALLRIAPAEHLLLLNLHHVVADGWSTGVLVRELAGLYQAFGGGAPSPFAELAVQYVDYAAWQRKRLSAEMLGRELAWWRERLAGAPQALELPADRPRPAVRTTRGMLLSGRLPGALGGRLRALGQREGATPYVVLLAGFAAWLARATGQDDLVVGSPAAGRTRTEIEPLIGCFVNPLALRLRAAAADGLAALVRRLSDLVVEAQSRQELPFEKLVDELALPRDLSRTPLFQVAFVVQTAPVGTLTAPGLTIERRPLSTDTAKFDLTLTLSQAAGEEAGWTMEWEASRDLFDRATVRRFMDQYRRLLTAAVAEPGQRLGELSLLSPGERQALLYEWNAPRSAGVSELGLHGLLAARAQAAPDRVAVVDGAVQLSYDELVRRARGVAGELRSRGVRRGDRVGLRLERGAELLVGLAGILETGAAYVPLDPAYPVERTRFLLDDCGAAAVVASRALAVDLPFGMPVVAVEETAPWDGPWQPSEAGSADLAYVIYTSGSTGTPKGVLVPHAQVERLFSTCREAFGFGEGDAWSLFHSYAFDFSVWEIWGAWLYGGRLVSVPYWVSRSPEDFRQLLACERVTVLNQTPSAFRQLVRAEGEAGETLDSLRYVVFGGEALEMEALRPWLDRHSDRTPRLVNMYGITETTVHVTYRPLSAADLALGSRVGRPLPDLESLVLDRDLAPVPVGVAGEICVAGAGLAWGYLGRAELSARCFVPHPFAARPGARLYRSGDLARWRPDGDLEYLGRLDHQVKVRGFRIELGEIETALAAHPRVAEAVVLVRTDVPGSDGAELVAYLVPAPGERPEPPTVREHLASRLPQQMVPGLFVVLERLPLTENGKVDRRALPVPERGTGAGVVRTPPRTATEKTVGQVWREVLGVEELGVEESFFDLGGHSLLATRLLARVSEVCKVELSLKALFEAPTVAELTLAVERARETAGAVLPPLMPVPRTGPLPASFAQERMWLYERLHPGTPTYNTYRAGHTWGPLSVGAARATYQGLLDRHEVLRTRMTERRGEVVQIIETLPRQLLGVVDLTRMPPAARAAQARRLAFEDAERPISLAVAPVTRARLLRLAPEEHVFLLSIHHAAYDLWSGPVVLGEFEQLYRAAAQGEPAVLPPQPVQYADVAVWQRRWMTGAVMERELAWWQQRLAGIHDRPMELPTDRRRPAAESVRGHSLYPELSVAQREGLWALARSRGVSQYMLLLAVFEAVLARWAGSAELVVGSFVAQRNRPEMERVVGYLDNTLVLATDGSGDPPFEAFLERVKETCLEAFAHPYVPYESLVAAMNPRRDSGYLGLFRVAFILELDYPAMEREIAELTVKPYNTHSGTAKFDLGLGYREAPTGLVGELEFNTDLFDVTTMLRFALHLSRLVDGVLEDPSLSLSRLPYLSPAELHQVLHAEHGIPAPAEARLPVAAQVARRAEAAPDSVAVVCGGVHLSYGETAGRAAALAAELAARGAGADTPVGVYLERSAEAVWAILGVLWAGACYVPLDPEYPQERLSYMLSEPGAAGIVTDRRLAGRFAGLAGWTLPIEDVPRVAPAPPRETPAGGSAYVIYTSGSTGRPKGVVNRHGSLASFVAGYRRVMGHEPGQRLLTVLSLAFDASVGGMFPALAAGATLILDPATRAPSAAALTELVEREQVTLLDIPVNFWNHWTEELEHAGVAGRLPSLTSVVSGGEPVYRERLDAWAASTGSEGVFVGAYGPTETTVAATVDPTRGSAAVPVGTRRLPIGRPIPGVRAYLLGSGGRPVGLGSVGEIFLGGGNVTRGYLNEPRATAERFVPDPFADTLGERLYRTGDWGRRLADGRLVFVERRDQQVKIRGFRIEPAEVEAALATHAAVAVCAVRPWRRCGAEAYLAAYMVPQAGAAAPPTAELRRHLEKCLPGHMIPAAFVMMAELPHNPASGKVDYRALPEPGSVETSRRPLRVAPRTPTEARVAEIFASVLGVESPGVSDDFFDLGGHSLLATRLLSRLREAFEVELPLPALFAAPTVEEVARAVEARAGLAELELPPLVPAPRGPRSPASFGQERLWWIHRMEPDDSSYNMPHDLLLVGPLSVPAVAGALSEVVRRHEALRTVFDGDLERGVVQVVRPPEWMPLPRVDLCGLEPARRRSEARHLAEREARRPFRLTTGPVLRATLVRLVTEEHALFVTLHHVVSDGWSMAVLTGEVAELYGGYLAGTPSTLPELPVQVADHALWQRSWLAGDLLQAELDHWRRRLGGMPPQLELPLDRPRPPVPTNGGAWLARRLSPEHSAALTGWARRRGATTFMVLLATFEALLYRLTGQREFGIGTPVAGRDRAEIEGLIGFFVNTLVLPARLGRRPTFATLVERCRIEALEAQAHQHLPFGKLVAELAPDREYGQTPLYQVMFLVQEMLLTDLALPGLEVLPLASPDAGTRPLAIAISRAAHVDMIFKVNDSPEGSEALLEYSTDVFDAATIRRFLAWWTRLVEAAVAEPERPVAELPLLSAAERHHLLAEWNDTGTDGEAAQSIPALFAERAAETPEAPALLAGDDVWSYRRLAEESGRWARRLAALGVGWEVPVAVSLPRSPEQVAVLLGILGAGGLYVPLDPEYPEERLAFLLADSGARVLVTAGELAGRLPAGSLPVVRIDRADGLAEAPVGPEPGAEDLAYVLYTSGSTGRPKGVAVPHRAVVRLVRGSSFADLGRERTWLQLAPVSFDASTLEIWAPLLNGGRLAVHPPGPFSPHELARSVERHGVDSLWLTAALFHQLVETRPDVPARLRQLLAGGDVLSPACCRRALEAAPDLNLVNGYGPTENTTFTCCYRMTAAEPFEGGSVPVGRPVSATLVFVADRDLSPQPIGVAGELVTGGLGLARGYWRRPAATAAVFVPHPWGGPGERLYRTGDRARRLPDGRIEFLGRLDQQVKIRGFRVEPGEVETVLTEHPAVTQAAVLVAGEGEDRHLVALAAPASQQAGRLDAAELARWLSQRLPAHLVPARLLLVDALPVTPNGKLDRRAAAALAKRQESPAEPEGAPPEGPVEELVAGVMADLLGVPRVGRDEDFFRLGGHSLLAMRLVSRLGESLGTDLPLAAFFETPTIAGLAAVLEAGRTGAAEPLAGAAPEERPPLSLAQQRLWFLARLQPASPAYNVPLAARLPAGSRVPLWRDVLGEIVRRHEPLRTRFALPTAPGAQPYQEVLPPAPVPPPVVDLAALSPADRERQTRRLVGREAVRPFDLERGLPSRFALLAGGGRGVLLATLHHAVCDDWSLGLVNTEATALDDAFRAGRPSPLADLPVRYADFAAWQRRRLATGEGERQLDHRAQVLAGAPRVLEVPIDRPRPVTWNGTGAACDLALPPAVARALEACCRAAGATPFMALLAVFGALLSRWSGRQDLLVGVPVAGRPRRELEDLIGFFVNTVAVLLGLGSGPSLDDLLPAVRSEVLDAFACQEVPFEQLVERLDPGRDLGRNPLVQVTFAYQNAGRVAAVGESVLEPLATADRTARFDLSLSVDPVAGEVGEALACSLAYATALYDATTARRLLAAFGRLLTHALERPEVPLSTLPLLSSAEWHQLAVEPGAAEDVRTEATLTDLFARRAEERPDAVAIADGDRQVTFGELGRVARCWAGALVALGAGPGARVGLFLPTTADALAALLAVLETGAAYVPLDPVYPAERVELILADAGVDLLVAEPAVLETAGRLPRSVRVLGLADLARTAATTTAAAANLAGPTPDDPAYVIYTSGSTGRPKGVEVTHRHVARLLAAAQPWFGFGPDDVWSLFHSLAFDFSVWELWGSLAHGGRVVVVPLEVRRDPERFHRLLATHQVTVLDQTPSAFRQLDVADETTGARLPALSWVIFGGEALAPASLVGWLGRYAEERPRLVNMYGITETTVHVTFRPLGRRDLATASRIGRPIPDLTVHVTDPRGEPVPFGVAGEIMVGGAGVSRGYAGRPALTARRFVPDPFSGRPGARLYRSGDLARRLPDGDLEYLGRADQQVQVRGFRVEPGEIEAALEASDRVERASVLALPVASGDLRLVAFVVSAPDVADGWLDDLRRDLARRVPPYMLPGRILPIAALPLTPHGKTDRRALARLAEEEQGGALGRAASEPPRGPVESAVARLWGELLGVVQVGRHESFFELGGHSLLAVEAAARLTQELGRPVPLSVLFENPSPEALSHTLEKGGSHRRLILVPLSPRGHRPPAFLVHPVGGNVVCYHELARRLPGPVYGLQAPSPDDARFETLEEQAALYVQAVCSVAPYGPCRLAGWSLGGVVAFEMARQLAAAGRPVHLALLDSRPPAHLGGADAAAMRHAFSEDLAEIGPVHRTALPDDELSFLYALFRANWNAAAGYRPRRFPGALLLIATADSRRPGDGAGRGWEALADAVQVAESAADHYSLLRPPHVADVAARLAEHWGEDG